LAGRTGAVVRQNSGANFGEFCGGYAWTDLGGHGAQGFGDDLAAGAEFFELFWSVNRHSTSSQQLGLDDGLILKTRPYTAISCSRTAAAAASAARKFGGRFRVRAIAGAVCGTEDGELDGVLFACARWAGDFLVLLKTIFSKWVWQSSQTYS